MHKTNQKRIIICILITLCLCLPVSSALAHSALATTNELFVLTSLASVFTLEIDRNALNDLLHKIILFLNLLFSLPIIKALLLWVRHYKADVIKKLKLLLPNKYKGNYLDSLLVP